MDGKDMGKLNGENGGNGTQENNKIGFFGKIHNGYLNFKTTTGGKWTVRITKGLALVGFGGLMYKKGVKSVKPTTIYIREGVTEDDESTEEDEISEEDVVENNDDETKEA